MSDSLYVDKAYMLQVLGLGMSGKGETKRPTKREQVEERKEM